MAGAFSGHLVDSYNIVSHGGVSFNPSMHGTPMSQQPSFSMFGTQGAMAYETMSDATVMKIAALQTKLNQKLGPEYISQRPGPGGGPKLTYAEGWKIINLANEVFGFNGWSSNIVNMTTDYIDYNEETRRYNVGVTAVIRVTLRDGVFHEDLGYGLLENSKSKGQALDKCKKEAVTDGLKRALRNFGNLLGNCLYDKSYTQEVVKIKIPPPKFDKSELHRRPEFEESKPNIAPNSAASTFTSSNSSMSSAKPVQYQRPAPAQQQHNGASAAVQVKKEPPITPNATAQANHIVNDPKGQAPQRPQSHSMPPPPPPPAIPQNAKRLPQEIKQERRVSFASSTGSAAAASTSITTDIDFDDSFHGFSDDDAFLATIDLEDLGPPIAADDSDMGRPIEPDMDLGQPIDYPESGNDSVSSTVSVQSSTTIAVSHQTTSTRQQPRTSSSRLQAIIAAQLEQQHLESASSSVSAPAGNGGPSVSDNTAQPSRITLAHPAHTSNSAFHQRSVASESHNENRNPQAGHSDGHPQPRSNIQSTKTGGSVKRAPTPSMGGFQFPPGVTGHLQINTSSGIGMKRPVEAISNGHRGSRPGMGLQQATAAMSNPANGRQVLGRLDNGDGGDSKRVRR